MNGAIGVSFLIPAYNEAATIGEVLARIDALELDAQIVVVDDGSTDATASIVEAYAAGRPHVAIERVAINVDDARIPDNAGASPVDAPIAADGPAAYFATLPIKSILVALREAGIPATISQTAGTYVCNHVFYGLMHALRRKPRVRGGFVHVPYAPADAARHPGAASLSLELTTEALRIALRTTLATTTDRRIAAGA